MNKVQIIVQSRDDRKNLLDSVEKAVAFFEGLTVVFIEGATSGVQLGIELIIKGADVFGKPTIIGFPVTENNFEGILGGFIGVRMRFGRMPQDQYEIVRHYVKQQVNRFIDTLDTDKRTHVEPSIRRFFNC